MIYTIAIAAFNGGVISRYLGMFSLDKVEMQTNGIIVRVISRYLGMFSLDTDPFIIITVK